MDYDQFVRGCHLGVFPSYYEPWGYTPAECTALGVPSVCSDLSGFGTFIREHIPDHESRGLYVIKRRGCGDTAAIEQLTRLMFDFSLLDRRERIALRNRTEQTSDLLDWSSLGGITARRANWPSPGHINEGPRRSFGHNRSDQVTFRG